MTNKKKRKRRKHSSSSDLINRSAKPDIFTVIIHEKKE